MPGNTTTNPPVEGIIRAFNIGSGQVTSTTQGNATAGSSTTMFYVSMLLPWSLSAAGLKVLLGTGGNGNIVAGLYAIDGQTLFGSVASVATGTTATTQTLLFASGAVPITGPRHVLAGFILSSASDSLRTVSAVFDAGSNPMCGSVTVTANTLPATFTPSLTPFTANTGAYTSLV